MMRIKQICDDIFLYSKSTFFIFGLAPHIKKVISKILFYIVILFAGLGIWFLGLGTSLAQTSKVDSLKTQLSKPLHDTTRIKRLNALGWELMYGNPDTAIILGKQALQLCTNPKSLPAGRHGLILIPKSFLANTLGNLGAYNYLKSDYPKALGYYLNALKLNEEMLSKARSPSEKQAAQKGIAARLGNIGLVYSNQADYPKALANYLKALKMNEELGNKNGIAATLGNIGHVYLSQADYPNALDNYLKALKIGEELGDKNRIAIQLGNIGIVYSDQADYPKALDYYLKALKIAEELGNKNHFAAWLGNIGNVYLAQADYPKVHPVERDSLLNRALANYLKALKTFEELGDKNRIATILGNIGGVYADQADYPKVHPVERDSLLNRALDYYLKALKINEELGNKNHIAVWLGNIGSLYIKTGKFAEAEVYLKKALAIDTTIGFRLHEENTHESLSHLYDTTAHLAAGSWQLAAENYKLSMLHYKKAMVLHDTIFSEENKKLLIRKEMTYQFEKKELAAKAEQEKKDAVAEAERKKEKVIRYSVIGSLALMFMVALVIFRSLRITRRQKILIEKQKKVVDEKNKDITDSIRYARTIQDAILPFEARIAESLSEFFILYKPKDVVSGDFYWFAEKDGMQVVVAADCTGHGVPGAFMSMIGNDLLNDIVNVRGITRADIILNELHKGIRYALKQEQTQNRDGMDIALAVIDIKNRMLQYAGAKNPLVYIQNNELFLIKADKLAIGGLQEAAEKERLFTLNEIALSSPTTFYLFTDGYHDQFGGPKGKKFMLKHLYQILCEHHQKLMSEQKETLGKAIDEWKGAGVQIDDILLIGVRV